MSAAPDVTIRAEFARGWSKVLTGFLGLALGITGLYFYTVGVFIRPLQAEFGWSRAEASLAATMFSLALAGAGPLCGLAVDRLGVRPVAALSILCFSACLWGLSAQTGSLPMFVALTVAVAVLGSATSAVPYVRLIGNWFERGRGLALGSVMVGTGVAAAVVPPMVARWVAADGWRAGYQFLAVIALLALPLVLLWGNERRKAEAGAAAPALPGLSFGAAAAQARFWVLGVTFTFAGCAIAGLITHLPPLMQDAGATPAGVGAVMGTLGLAVIAGRLLTGVALDHVFAPYIAATVLALAAVGCVGVAWLGQDAVLVCAALIGLAMGSEIDLAGYMSARYFGLRSYGTIFGAQYGMFSLGAAIGPLAIGLSYDRFGHYQPALWAAAAILALGIPMVLSLGAYPERSEG